MIKSTNCSIFSYILFATRPLHVTPIDCYLSISTMNYSFCWQRNEIGFIFIGNGNWQKGEVTILIWGGLVDHYKETKAALDGSLSEIVSAVDFQALYHFLAKKMSRYRQSVQETHERKLSSIGARLHLSSCKPEKVIFNYSNRKLNQRDEFLLSFGLDFNLPIHKLYFFKYFLPVEKLISCLKDCSIRDGYNLDRVVERIKSVCFNVYYKFKSNNIFSPIFNKSDVNLLKTLGKDQPIVICPPDKGRGVVILNRPVTVHAHSTPRNHCHENDHLLSLMI